MKSFDQTLESVHGKIRETEVKIERRKRRAAVILCSVALPCLVIGAALSVFYGSAVFRSSRPGVLTDSPETGSAAPVETSAGGDTARDETGISTDIEPGIYPQVWKKLNAAIVRWGERTDGDRPSDWDWLISWESGEPVPYKKINYYAVPVTVLKVFSQTVSGGDIADRGLGFYDSTAEGQAIERAGVIMIPESLLETAKPGGEALAFVDVKSRIVCDPEGKPLMTDGPDGSRVPEVEYILELKPAARDSAMDSYAVFPLINGILEIPESAYMMHEGQRDGYRLTLMEYLETANRIVKREGLDIPLFESGADTDDLDRFFAFVGTCDYSR